MRTSHALRSPLAHLCAVVLLHIGVASAGARGTTEESYAGRSLLVHVPSVLPAPGIRALVVVLHGGLGNARRIENGGSESGLDMDAAADRAGFVVAYLNGTPVTRRFGADTLGWNAGGGCCGQPAEYDVDDVGYIEQTVLHLASQYGVDRRRIYGIGHSNGGMMTLRVMCERNLYAAAVSIAGPLNLDPANCAAARGKRILAIHGEEDDNVPILGGRGSRGISRAAYNSEERSRQSFVNAGAAYDLQVVRGADHKLEHIEHAILRSKGESIAEMAARFMGLLHQDR